MKMKINAEVDVRGRWLIHGRRGYQKFFRGIQVAISGILMKLLVF